MRDNCGDRLPWVATTRQQYGGGGEGVDGNDLDGRSSSQQLVDCR